VENWLAALGRHVFEQVPFPLAVIGWEPSPDWCAEEIQKDPPAQTLLVRRSGRLDLRRGAGRWAGSQPAGE
jgi:hypothetical protein